MTDQYSSLTETELKAVMSLCIMAAFADGALSELERAEIRRIADSLSGDDQTLASAYQQALNGKADLPAVARDLQSANAKALGYEMAACICNVDQSLSEAERKFLSRLREEAQLDPAATAEFDRSAERVREEPPLIASVVPAAPNVLDEMIRDRAMLAGALELMPQRLATMAIVPIQMRMVYQIGKACGYQLDMSHTKEFLATVGVGLTCRWWKGMSPSS
jgi:uncharacterized tellurite resistance protein B-like protein